MYNPYKILNISNTADEQEIKEARKKQIELQCGSDENKKNHQGEYLKDVINEAAKDLLNKEKREIIDKMLEDKNLPMVSNQETGLVPISSVVMNHINTEVISKMPSITLKRSIFHKKVECKKFFGVIGSDSSFNYTVEKITFYEGKKHYYLSEYFTESIFSNFAFCDKCPWNHLQVFEADGIDSIAYPIYRLVPNILIYNGKIEDEALRQVYPIIKQSIMNMQDELNQLFKEKEKVKEKE